MIFFYYYYVFLRPWPGNIGICFVAIEFCLSGKVSVIFQGNCLFGDKPTKLDDLMIGLHIQLHLHVREPHKICITTPYYIIFYLLQFRIHDYHIYFHNVGAQSPCFL
jgi:hypothetical protein